jgi:hypothetical protein
LGVRGYIFNQKGQNDRVRATHFNQNGETLNLKDTNFGVRGYIFDLKGQNDRVRGTNYS